MKHFIEKQCKKCFEVKDLSEFSKAKRNHDGAHSYCKSCMSLYANEWVKKQGGIEYTREVHYQRKFNIAYADVLLLLEKQNYKCAICEGKVSLEIGRGFTHKAHVDHCHTTNKIRGILCGNCNTALGKLGDDIESIERVLKYLKGELNVQANTSERKFPQASAEVVPELRRGSTGNSEVSPYSFPWSASQHPCAPSSY